MDFFEAMSLMKNGEKIRIKSWPKDMFIGVREEKVKIFGKNKTKYTALSGDEIAVSPSMSFPALLQAEWRRYRDEESDDSED